MKKEIIRSLSLISQLGISVMVPMFLCLGIGLLIDKKFGTSTTIWLILLGICAGARNAYILAKKVLEENARESTDRYKNYGRKDLWQDEHKKN